MSKIMGLSAIKKNMLVTSHLIFLVLLIWYFLDMGRVSFQSIFGLLFFNIAAYINLIIYTLPGVMISIVISKKSTLNINNTIAIVVSWLSVIISIVIIFTTNDGPFTLNIPDSYIGEFVILAASLSYLISNIFLSKRITTK